MTDNLLNSSDSTVVRFNDSIPCYYQKPPIPPENANIIIKLLSGICCILVGTLLLGAAVYLTEPTCDKKLQIPYYFEFVLYLGLGLIVIIRSSTERPFRKTAMIICGLLLLVGVPKLVLVLNFDYDRCDNDNMSMWVLTLSTGIIDIIIGLINIVMLTWY